MSIPPTVTPSASATDSEDLVRAACLAVPPLWGLPDAVAVNPFLGHASSGLLDAEDAVQRCQHAAVLPGWEILRAAWRDGDYREDDLHAGRRALEDGDAAPTVRQVRAWLDDDRHRSPPSPRCLSIAEVLATDRHDWATAIREDLGRFAAARTDRGVGRWQHADAGGWWATWRAWMRHDRSMAARGVRGLSAYIAALPADAVMVRHQLLTRLGLDRRETAMYLGRLLGGLPGWAGWLRQQAWRDGHERIGDLPELLTMRLVLDVALADLRGPRGTRPEVPAPGVAPALAADRRGRLLAVGAWEHRYRTALVGQLRPAAAPRSRPAAQAVFCIDVRSEGLRRHCEASDAMIETYGFAGFFAMPVAIAGDANSPPGAALRACCPVLLAPAAHVRLETRPAGRLARLLGSFRRSGVGGFAYMELCGLASAWSLAAGSLGDQRATVQRGDEEAPLALDGIPADQQLALLRGMLANLGLAAPHARLVMLCGHDCTVSNNPQGAALACGACGGHSGGINARMAARLYNDAALRAQLGDLAPPQDSIAVAAVHDTTTDEVRILDAAHLPESHAPDLARLRRTLASAGQGQRAQRVGSLSGISGAATASQRLRQLVARSRDWAELQPEWGLVDNAAFIVAPRSMTSAIDLGGRAFLHSYCAELDPTGAVLGMILTAPAVVASWINLQYWASAVDPGCFGSGNKAVHSIVGGIGVASGGDGDLRQGLSLQSVHDRQRLRHRPLRLQIFVAAPASAIDAVVAGHAHLRDLVTKGWVCLHAIDPATAACRRRLAQGGWEPVAATSCPP